MRTTTLTKGEKRTTEGKTWEEDEKAKEEEDEKDAKDEEVEEA